LTHAKRKTSLADSGREHLILTASTPLEALSRLRGGESADLVFAGLHFRLPARLLEAVPILPHTWPLHPDTRTLAWAECELEPSADLPLVRRGGQAILWSWEASGQWGQTCTRDLQIELQRLGPRQFRVRARVPEDLGTLTSLLSAVAPPLLHALGGTVLHAASVELGGRAIAFVGPSGAGKSTACRHVAGARSFTLDRLAVAPGPSSWVACPLPGGKGWEDAVERSGHSLIPLAAVLRVMHCERAPQIGSCPRHRAVALLRQAAFHGDRSPLGELQLLEALEGLTGRVPVGTLGFALGDELGPAIERFIHGRTDS
jgi:hypothetical protein